MSPWKRKEGCGLASHFGSLELAILEVLWSRGEMDVADCLRLLAGDQAYTTVKTVMERLAKKGFLGRRKHSRSYVYWATRSRVEVAEEIAAAQTQQLVEGFGDLAVTHFVKSVRGNPEQVAQLRDLLADIAEGDHGEHPRTGGGA
ncbi:MAG: BlaI/MecI/CopY family transcriptional regulator [Kutzneria sp.]|nr:BlaI/MecI/CopY family transcriptional regulator [Kutzneria sp.]MBV9844800.1 BlaI/MecI/CopY family transcriptional regulator [Kutzneria sp.]